MSANMVYYPRDNTHAPDFDIRVLGEEALRCGESVVIDLSRDNKGTGDSQAP